MELGWETDLPGFRFHPTEEELLEFFLKGAVQGLKLISTVIAFLDIYQHDPSELPGLSRVRGKEWYFFVSRERSISNGGKPKRTTRRGFWKGTGSERSVHSVSDPGRLIGLKKTLVFYEGRAPRGNKTDWIMNEYRLPDGIGSSQLPKANVVLCKIYRKAKSMTEMEKKAVSVTSSMVPLEEPEEPEESTRETTMEAEVSSAVPTSEVSRSGVKFLGDLGMLQVPPRLDFDWAADPNLARTPWLDHVSPCYANIFNF